MLSTFHQNKNVTWESFLSLKTVVVLGLYIAFGAGFAQFSIYKTKISKKEVLEFSLLESVHLCVVFTVADSH